MDQQPMDLCFVAAHPAGSLRLRLPNPTADGTAAGAAIALDGCDGLLAALDGWMTTELDWQWEDEQRPATVGATNNTASAVATASGWRLEAPWSLLRSNAAPPAPLASCLRWDDTPALVTLCRLFLDEAEQAAIEPGGAVVLPDSLRPGWRGWLHLPGEDPEQGLPVPLEGPIPAHPGSARSPEPAPSNAGAMRPCQVRLALHRPLSASWLAGWQDPGALLAEPAARMAELWIGPFEAAGASRLLAHGRLLPWGHGWAMMIDQLH